MLILNALWLDQTRTNAFVSPHRCWFVNRTRFDTDLETAYYETDFTVLENVFFRQHLIFGKRRCRRGMIIIYIMFHSTYTNLTSYYKRTRVSYALHTTNTHTHTHRHTRFYMSSTRSRHGTLFYSRKLDTRKCPALRQSNLTVWRSQLWPEAASQRHTEGTSENFCSNALGKTTLGIIVLIIDFFRS